MKLQDALELGLSLLFGPDDEASGEPEVPPTVRTGEDGPAGPRGPFGAPRRDEPGGDRVIDIDPES